MQPDASAMDQRKPAPQSSSVVSNVLFYTVFFLSGAAALIYEISWSRQIGLLFGHTVHAASVVLASYFAGMATGYLIGARLCSHVRPLTGYAIAELIAAAWACAIPFVLDFSESSTVAGWLSSPSFFWQTTSRVVFSFLLLLPATIALGATLPMMAAFLSRTNAGGMSNKANASRVTFAYALNTAGALTGVLVATFYLLVNAGVTNSSFIAAALSVACAIGAVVIGRTIQGSVPQNTNAEPVPADNDTQTNTATIYTLAAVSGFGTLALQVLYTRMFSLVFHNSTYTFGLVVAVFLAALSLGAAFASLAQRRFRASTICTWAIIGGSLATCVSVLTFIERTQLKYFSYGESFSDYIFGALMLVSLVVGPPVLLLGMILPLVWKLAGNSGSTGRVVGRITALNTICAALGALATSFLLLRYVGLWESFVLLAAVLFATASLIAIQNGKLIYVLVPGILLVIGCIYTWRAPIESELTGNKSGEQIVKRWNSPYGWIDVVKIEGTDIHKIRQNLHYRFGRTGGNARELRQAHIPLLLHGDPSDVLFLGLGTGLTAGGAIPHAEVDSIVAVELIPEVVEAIRMLAEFNNNVIDHPKTDVRVDDGRHYLLATDRKFDVIVSDLFVPWESESGYLYTVEHYEVAKTRLKENGIFCQWLPLYQVGTEEFESIANSFANVFPHTSIWWGQMSRSKPVIALIATDDPVEINPTQLMSRMESLWSELDESDPNIDCVDDFRDHYIGDWATNTNVPLNTDEYPRVEFLTPVTNRNRKLINDKTFREYYMEVFAELPDTLEISGPEGAHSTSDKSRARQQVMVFGG